MIFPLTNSASVITIITCMYKHFSTMLRSTSVKKHKEWRKVAKRERRRKIRKKLAQERDTLLEKEENRRQNSPLYQVWLVEQQAAELFKKTEEERLNEERNEKWLRDELIAQVQFRQLQTKIARAKEEKAKQDLRIRQEWEAEQQKIKDLQAEKELIQQEKQRKFDLLTKQIDNFIANGGDIPAEITVPLETNPGKDPCPFFSKTGACRFGDRCSRNHTRPGISKVLLIPNFYTHFGLEHGGTSEYSGSDLLLEYEDHETLQHFQEFFQDVFPEFEAIGPLTQFKVCNNNEQHLRGNVYVEYKSTRDAVKAFKLFQGRWYGGKRLNVEFCNVTSWRMAICGLYFKKKCPKGNSCNFLHVFLNPGNLFSLGDQYKNSSRRERNDSSRSRSWSRSARIENDGSTHRRADDGDYTPDHDSMRWSSSPEEISLGSNSEESKRNDTRRKYYHGRESNSSSSSLCEASRSHRRSNSRDRDRHSERRFRRKDRSDDSYRSVSSYTKEKTRKRHRSIDRLSKSKKVRERSKS